MVEVYLGMGMATRMLMGSVLYNGRDLRKQAGDALYRMAHYAASSYIFESTNTPKWTIVNPIRRAYVYGVVPDGTKNEGGADVSFLGVGATNGLFKSALLTGSCSILDINNLRQYSGIGVNQSPNVYAPPSLHDILWQLAQFGATANRIVKTNDLSYPSTFAAFANDWVSPDVCWGIIRDPIFNLPVGYGPYYCVTNTTMKQIKAMCYGLDNMRHPHLPMVYRLISGPGVGHGMGDANNGGMVRTSNGLMYVGGPSFETLFNKAPACGCYNYSDRRLQSNANVKIDPKNYGDWYWSSVNWFQDYANRGSESENTDYNYLDYMNLFNLYSLNTTDYINYYFNPYYKENFRKQYPWQSYGMKGNSLAINFLEYLSLKNNHESDADVSYRGAKVIDILPGFEAKYGSSVQVYVKDYTCNPEDKSNYYNYASLNGKRVVEIGGYFKGTGEEDSTVGLNPNLADALDMVPFHITPAYNPDYDTSIVETDTLIDNSNDSVYQAMLQHYKDSLINIVISSGDTEMVNQLYYWGIIDSNSNIGNKAAPLANGNSNGSKEIFIYPNPTTGSFTVVLDASKSYTISVGNIMGTPVMCRQVHRQGVTVLQLSDNSPSGIYIVTIESDQNERVVKNLTLMR